MRTNERRHSGQMPSPPSKTGLDLHLGAPTPPRPNAMGLSDTIQPFLATGGEVFWIFREDLGTGVVYDPAPVGAQLVASVYVPDGRVGFLKELRIGPYKPSVLADTIDVGIIEGPFTTLTSGPFTGDVVPSNIMWQTGLGAALSDVSNTQDIIYSKVWQTPFGWEAYLDPDSPFQATPMAHWTWQLTIVQGSIDALRRSKNIPVFNFVDPTSWYLADNFPVPMGPTFNAYPAGIPGNPVGVQFQPQRMQSPPDSPLHLNLFVPSDSTLCLFARWEQKPTTLRLIGTNKDLAGDVGFFGGVLRQNAYVLGPSFGSLLGYTQPVASQASIDNATHGWGG